MKSVMKKASLAMIAMAGVLVCAPALQAAETVRAKVPFAFVVNGVELPAGDYVVTRDASQPDLIEVSTAAGERVALTLTRGGEREMSASEQPRLEFERIGKQVYLTEITLGAGNSREIVVDTPHPKP